MSHLLVAFSGFSINFRIPVDIKVNYSIRFWQFDCAGN